MKKLLQELNRRRRRKRSMARRQRQSVFHVPDDIAKKLNGLGFSSDAYYLYNLDPSLKSIEEYLSYLDWAHVLHRINGAGAEVLEDKLKFPKALGSFESLVPVNRFTITNGRITSLVSGETVSLADFQSFITSKPLIIKPVDGRCGRGVFKVDGCESDICVNGKPETIGTFLNRLTSLGDTTYIACDWVSQHQTLASIYSRSANTVRIQTYFDQSMERAEIAGAALRIGTDESAPADNAALSAGVDIQSGRLGKAKGHKRKQNIVVNYVEQFSKHPDTGSQIESVVLPNWPEVKRDIIEIASTLPDLHFIGWDVLITDSSIVIIEANPVADMDLLQLHKPLLANKNFKAFCERNGVVSE